MVEFAPTQRQTAQLLRLCRDVQAQADVTARRLRLVQGLCDLVGAVAGLGALFNDDFTAASDTVIFRRGTPALAAIAAPDGDSTPAGPVNLLSFDNPMARPFLESFTGRLFAPTAMLRRDAVEDRLWHQSPFYQSFMKSVDLDDCILSAVPLPDLSPFIAIVCLSAAACDNPWRIGARFTPNDCALIGLAHAELRWAYYPAGAAPPDGADDELDPRDSMLLRRSIGQPPQSMLSLGGRA